MHFSNRDSKRGTWGVLATAVLMTTFLFGCGGDPYAGKYTKTQPNSQSFSGEWTLKQWTMKRGPLPSPLPKIVFQGDGSFKATNYPGEALNSFGTSGSFLDGEGTWSVGSRQGFGVIEINWQKAGGKPLDYGQPLNILNDKPPYVLHHVIGDPDSGEALVFEKTK
jgi:hypothetical protein